MKAKKQPFTLCNIFKPGTMKLILTFVFASISVIIWTFLVGKSILSVLSIVMYIVGTLVWLIFSAILASVLVHCSNHSRITSVTFYQILIFLLIIAFTMVYFYFEL
jgi:hypothetical protein